jgi:sulfur carrier protein
VEVIANGQAVVVDDGARLTDLYRALGVDAKWVVAEVNGEAIPRWEAAGTSLRAGDRVEVVRAVAGG